MAENEGLEVLVTISVLNYSQLYFVQLRDIFMQSCLAEDAQLFYKPLLETSETV